MDAIGILEISSFVSTGIFGIINATLKTKNQDGQLTRWGKISVIGILIGTTLSITTNRIRSDRDSASHEKAKQKEIEEGIKREEQYERNIQYQKDILDKTQASLESQKQIREGTEKNLTGINQSLLLQGEIRGQTLKTLLSTNEIFSSTKEINTKQESVLQNTLRTLNPLVPFTVYARVEIPFSNPSIKGYLDSLKKMKSKIETMPGLDSYDGAYIAWSDDKKTVRGIYSISGTSSLMPPPNSEILITHPSLSFKLFSKNPIISATSDSLHYPDLSFECYNEKSNLQHYGTIPFYTSIGVSFERSEIIFEVYYDYAEINIGSTGKISSIPDLENSFIWVNPLAYNDNFNLTTIILYTGLNSSKPVIFSFKENEILSSWHSSSKTYLHKITDRELNTNPK